MRPPITLRDYFINGAIEWGAIVALVLILGASAFGCATMPAANGGTVYVIKGHDGACKHLARTLDADQIAWTAGKPIACGEGAAADQCLVAHEQVHEKEQAQHELGPAGWLFDWTREYLGCLKRGRTAADCHEHHSMEQDATIVQRVCEAERDAKGAAQ